MMIFKRVQLADSLSLCEKERPNRKRPPEGSREYRKGRSGKKLTSLATAKLSTGLTDNHLER
jgi:hypothetical protein